MIFDVLGRRVAEVEGTRSIERVLVQWDATGRGGRRVLPGIYFIRSASGRAATGRARVAILD